MNRDEYKKELRELYKKAVKAESFMIALEILQLLVRE